MASLDRALAGFVGGVADYGLDQLKSRQDEEREVRKAKLLEDLRASTAERLASFEDKLRQQRGDKQFSGAEGDEFIVRNDRGVEVNRRALTAEEKKVRDLSLKSDELGVRNIESQIASRARDDARQDRVAASTIAANSRRGSEDGGDSPSGAVNDSNVANELFFRYKDEVTETVNSGNISRGALRAAAVDLAANSRTGQEAEQKFIEFMNRYRSGRAKTEQANRPNLNLKDYQMKALDEQ